MPPKPTTNWNDIEVWKRLVISIQAAGDVNNLHEVAKHMGVSYDTLQNKFRTIKKDATKLQEDVKDGKVVVPATPARTKSVPSTPKSNSKTAAKDPLHTVANGRIEKKTPSKKTPVKSEPKEDDTMAELGVDANESDVD